MFDQAIADCAENDQDNRMLEESASDAPMSSERLPFTVRIVRNEVDLWKAVQIRHAAYARHVPTLAQSLTAPEPPDMQPGVVVLLAESKVDGSPLGTMRIQTNLHRQLPLEQSVELPSWMEGKRMAEATRLGVTEARIGRVVKTVLFKAFYQYCERNRIEWMVVAGRAPIDRQYERLMFDEVFPGTGYVPLLHAANMPHRIMSFNVQTAEARWRAAAHPLFRFVCRTEHQDIDVGLRDSLSRQVFCNKVQQFSTVLTKVAVKNM
ncbi:MAG: hypothetical protein H7234_05550 [Herminiimonas sp.]|nr:hypothetical protein [Herminiimonas sp.]